EAAQEIVTARAEWRTPRELLVRLIIRAGFHLNAHDIAPELKLVPTTLTVADPQAAVRYPPAEVLAVQYSSVPLRVYSGEVALSVTFANPPAKDALPEV